MSSRALRSPAEIEKQERENAAMQEAVAKFAGAVTKIPTGARVTPEPKDRAHNKLGSYGPDAIERAEHNFGNEGTSRVAVPRGE